jgi:hypothetical protein
MMRKPTIFAVMIVAALCSGCAAFAGDTQTVVDRLGRPVARVATCVGGTCLQVYDRVGRPVAKVVKTAGKVVVYDRLGRRR